MMTRYIRSLLASGRETLILKSSCSCGDCYVGCRTFGFRSLLKADGVGGKKVITSRRVTVAWKIHHYPLSSKLARWRRNVQVHIEQRNTSSATNKMSSMFLLWCVSSSARLIPIDRFQAFRVRSRSRSTFRTSPSSGAKKRQSRCREK